MKIRPSFPRLAPFLLGGSLAAVYLSTIAPGLTWANGGSDGGDLIAAAATGGVAHPTGYPVYLLVAQLFQLLPIGSLAFRTNLLSAVCTLAAALLVYAVVERALRSSAPEASAWGGLVAGLAFGLSPLVWSQAVITEVYGLNLFFVALILYLLALPAPWSRGRNLIVGLVQGLAVGNQILAGLLIPATLACAALRHVHSGEETPARMSFWKKWRLDGRALLTTCFGLVVGLLSYAILPLRAAAHPPVNWGDPVTVDRFLWLVSGKLYQDQLLQLDLTTSWVHLRAWAGLTIQAFGVPGLVAALLGLVVFFRRTRLYFLTLWIALLFTAFAIQYEVVDSYVYLLPTFLAFSVWIGIGVAETMGVVSRARPRLDWVLGLACVGYLAVLGAQRWPQINASSDLRAEQFGQQVMGSAPSRAILFTRGDEAVLSLWYFHYALASAAGLGRHRQRLASLRLVP